MIFDEPFQVAFFSPLRNDNEFIVVSKTVDVLDDVGMGERLHQVDLLETFLTLFGVHHVENLFFTETLP